MILLHSWAAHTINRSGRKLLPKHLLRIPAGVGTESPAGPRSSSRISPALSESHQGCCRVRTPGKQLLGSSWLQTPGAGTSPWALQRPHRAGGGTAGGWHAPAPAPSPRGGTQVSHEPLCTGDGGVQRTHKHNQGQHIFLFLVFFKTFSLIPY